MARPHLLDLFCGAGGAAVGYHRAGFDVVGVDVKPQPNYPFEFIQADALEHWGPYEQCDFDAIHASPPCQFHTDLQAVAGNQAAHQELIGPTRELLEQTGLPYVIENVPGARSFMREPFHLCGTSFGLGWELRELRRHRLFETNWPVGILPTCAHVGRTIGVYGDHLRFGRRSRDGELSGPAALRVGSEAMGIGWMTWDELKESIPPAYTEYIGWRLLAHIHSGCEERETSEYAA